MNYISKPGSTLTNRQIVEKFLAITYTTIEELKSGSRKNEIVQYRQILMWILRTNDPRMCYRDIAELFNRNHSTAVVSKQKIDNFIHIGDHLGKQAQKIYNQILEQ